MSVYRTSRELEREFVLALYAGLALSGSAFLIALALLMVVGFNVFSFAAGGGTLFMFGIAVTRLARHLLYHRRAIVSLAPNAVRIRYRGIHTSPPVSIASNRITKSRIGTFYAWLYYNEGRLLLPCIPNTLALVETIGCPFVDARNSPGMTLKIKDAIRCLRSKRSRKGKRNPR